MALQRTVRHDNAGADRTRDESPSVDRRGPGLLAPNGGLHPGHGTRRPPNSVVQDQVRGGRAPVGGDEGTANLDTGPGLEQGSGHGSNNPGGSSPPGVPGGPPGNGAPGEGEPGGGASMPGRDEADGASAEGPPKLASRGETQTKENRPPSPGAKDQAAGPTREAAGKIADAAGKAGLGGDRGGPGGGKEEGGPGGGKEEGGPGGGPGPAVDAPAAAPKGQDAPAPARGGATNALGMLGSLGAIAFAEDPSKDLTEEQLAEQATRRAAAEAAANAFLQQNAGRVSDMVSEAQSTAETIRERTRAAVEQVAASTAETIDGIRQHYAQARDQVTNAAAGARESITTRHASAVTAIREAVASAKTEVQTAHETAKTTLDGLAQGQKAKLDTTYATWDKNYRAKGPEYATRATQLGARMAANWRGQKNGESSILDGPVHDNRMEARAEAAEKVAAEYNKGLVNAGDEQAAAAMAGKPQDIAFIDEQVRGVGQALDTQLTAANTSLDQVGSDSVSAADGARDQLVNAVEQQLQNTLAQLTSQENDQAARAQEHGDREKAALQASGDQAAQALIDGANQAAGTLTESLQAIAADLAAGAPPPPEVLTAALDEAQAEFDGMFGEISGQLNEGAQSSVNAVQTGLTGVQDTLQKAKENAAAGAGEQSNTFQGSMDAMKGQAESGFSQMETSARQTVTNAKQNTVTGFNNATNGVRTLFQTADGKLTETFEKGGKALGEGLDGALKKEEGDINKHADEAAAQVQPRWKKVLKVLLIVAVIVVVAVVAGPAVIGAVGAMAGALGASAAAAGVIGTVVGGAIVGAAAGAVIQVGNNAIDGKNLMDGVGKAALAGAIGGAFGGAGALLGGAASGVVGRMAIELGMDALGGIAGNLATGDPITLEGILVGAAIGLGVSGAVHIAPGIRAKISSFRGTADVTPPRVDTPNVKTDTPDVTPPRVEVDTPRIDADPPKVDATPPKVDTPDAPTVKAEAPKVEAPRVEEPKLDAPAPKVDEPQVAPPKTEPKVDDAAAPPVDKSQSGPPGRRTPVEDDFVSQYRKLHPESNMTDDELRAAFRNGDRIGPDGNLQHIKPDDAVAVRKQENEQLRNSDLFEQDLKARGVSDERLQWMWDKKCPLTFESPQQFQQFREELEDMLKKAGLADAQITMKGTSTTFYSENPKKALGHHFDANPKELADIDLGLSSPSMVDGMNTAGMTPHPQMPHIFKTRHTVEVYPQLKEFADRWQTLLGREVNFVGMTDKSPQALDSTDYLLHGSAPKPKVDVAPPTVDVPTPKVDTPAVNQDAAPTTVTPKADAPNTTGPKTEPTVDAPPPGRATPVEDNFIAQYRRANPGSTMTDDELRAAFRNGDRLAGDGSLQHIKSEDAVAVRKQENQQLRDSDLFQQDLRARGVSDERLQWMWEKKCPLTFENPQQFQQFKEELETMLKQAGLGDAQITMKGTSTTFYSENPKKALGHHFDANPKELADIDLGLSSPSMVDGMNTAGMAPHPQMPHIFKTRHTVEVYPQLKAFADRWEGILGREVNFVGMTDKSPQALDSTDYLLHSAPKVDVAAPKVDIPTPKVEATPTKGVDEPSLTGDKTTENPTVTGDKSAPAPAVRANAQVNPPPPGAVQQWVNPSELQFSQQWVSPKTSDGIPLDVLGQKIKQGWKGDAIDVVRMDDGALTSLDNRRVLAAQKEGVEEVPVNVHRADEPLTPDLMGRERALKNNIYRSDDGTLNTSGDGTLVYAAGTAPTTWRELILWRTAKQPNLILPGGGSAAFPVGGTKQQPAIGAPKKK